MESNLNAARPESLQGQFDWRRIHESEEEYPQGELVQEAFDDYLKVKVTKFLESKSLDLTEIMVDDDGEFSISYESRDFRGRMPNRISYILDDLCNMISEELGVGISWGFGSNGNCGTANFFPESTISKKFLDVKKALYLS